MLVNDRMQDAKQVEKYCNLPNITTGGCSTPFKIVCSLFFFKEYNDNDGSGLPLSSI